MNTIYLVTHCQDIDISFLKTLIDNTDIIVGIDQGALKLIENHITPHYYIGDWDSIPMHKQSVIKEAIQLKNIITLQTIKDDSDLEHAINYFAETKQNMVIINNLQGRVDHTLSAINLLAKDPNLIIRCADTDIHLSTGLFRLTLPLKTTISLIPFTETVENITTTGLFYPLRNETLHKSNNKGLSNFNLDKNIVISFSGGELLVIICRGGLSASPPNTSDW